MKLSIAWRSGKNSKIPFYLKGLRYDIFPPLRKINFDKIIEIAKHREDYDYILSRVEYYCKIKGPVTNAKTPLGDVKRKDVRTAYYFDLKEFTHGLPSDFRINFLPGDITYIPDVPTLLKSRPIAADDSNANSVLLKFNRIRHFIWHHDKRSYSEKKDEAVFRGKVNDKPKRISLFEKYFGDSMYDLGATDRHCVNPSWKKASLTLDEQLHCKWIFSIEGVDVSTNTKWIMNSNSIAVMPEPEYETWFMEGKLIPDVHYLRIKKDYSDLRERLTWLQEHPEKAESIIKAAHEFCEQFKDKKREKIITYLVLARYCGKF